MVARVLGDGQGNGGRGAVREERRRANIVYKLIGYIYGLLISTLRLLRCVVHPRSDHLVCGTLPVIQSPNFNT